MPTRDRRLPVTVLSGFLGAGAMSSVAPLGTWWAAVPEDRWPDHPAARAHLARHWAEPWGDRRQVLVFIGAGMDAAAIRAALDDCLVGPAQAARFTPEPWAALPDPFPVWRAQAPAAEMA